MNSKSFFSFVVILATLLAGFAYAQDFNKNENRQYDLPESPKFVEAERVVKINVKQSNRNYLELISDSKYAKGTEIQVDNGKVKVVGPKKIPFTKNSRIEFILHVTDLSVLRGFSLQGASTILVNSSQSTNIDKLAIELSGASSFGCSADIRELDVELSGASTARISGNFDKVDCELSGASNIDMSGHTRLLDLEISGASSANLKKLLTKVGKVEVSGASSATTNVNTELYYGVYGSSLLTNASEKVPEIRRGETSGFSKFNQK
ncbi:GIN domain-containing protein [Porphyromonas canoris]|uniref:Putative auto-transporter adhesin head GIN domain-containing protein n=1 Tax=Porphyromonas canoris TaxID=36875 RepID=A0ABR4XNF6_9PORP|nr:DUF2807 domain-containing protein [Porphyromonas canoris]KGN93329.1 hypothetical protein HQ43_01405 [Porphyromonas canoris]